MLLHITTVPGDGIGPEVIAQAVRVLETVAAAFGHQLEITEKKIGGAALLACNDPLPPDTIEACLAADAVLLGAVGGPAFDSYPRHLRPEAGLLRLRKELGAFANLRPAVAYPGLEDGSTLRPEFVHGMDVLIVRELLGGLYFGEPRSIEGSAPHRVAVNTMRYSEAEIERIARVAFDLAGKRRHKLVSVDKSNVLECSRLWREVVNRVAKEYPGVSLSHLYVDSAAMALVRHPLDFDVMLMENMFGDILSDLAGGVVGSLGLLASASVGGRVSLYEPVHGSAPDISGKGIANPLGAILSVPLLLRHSFQLKKEAECVETAVSKILQAGHRTMDLATPGTTGLSTVAMGDKITEAVAELSPRNSFHSVTG